jgi:hypothetical protein
VPSDIVRRGMGAMISAGPGATCPGYS